jgi:hypothetical protein
VTKTIWAILLAILLATGAFGLGHTFQTDGSEVDNTEFNLLVCFRSDDGTPLYQGVVDPSHFSDDYIKFTEDNGLTRFIVGATCVLTVGTAADFAAADKAAKLGGANEPDTSATTESDKVDAPQS